MYFIVLAPCIREVIELTSRFIVYPIIQELIAFRNGLTLTGGDLGSLNQLFFDNLSTLLGALFALQGLSNKSAFGDIAVSSETMNEYLWGHIVPGVGVTLFLGNVYYSWQAIRLTNKYGRQYTAQPYGLNTPAAFSFIFNIIYNIFFQSGGGDAGFIKGYKVGKRQLVFSTVLLRNHTS